MIQTYNREIAVDFYTIMSRPYNDFFSFHGYFGRYFESLDINFSGNLLLILKE